MNRLFTAGLLAGALVWASDTWAGHVETVVCPQLPALTGNVTTSAGGCSTTVGTVPAGATIADAIQQQFVVSTSQLSKTTDTTLATVTGLSIALTAGKTYNCYGHLTVTASGASGGIKVALTATNSLTATSASFTAANFNGTTSNARTTSTALGTAIGGATAVATDVQIDGAIVVNVAGTLNVQAAQNASNSTATVVGINSTFRCVRVN